MFVHTNVGTGVLDGPKNKGTLTKQTANAIPLNGPSRTPVPTNDTYIRAFKQ